MTWLRCRDKRLATHIANAMATREAACLLIESAGEWMIRGPWGILTEEQARPLIEAWERCRELRAGDNPWRPRWLPMDDRDELHVNGPWGEDVERD